MNALHDAWTPSTREEVLFILYAILSVIFSESGHEILSRVVGVKSGLCFCYSIYLTVREAKNSVKGEKK